MNKTNKILIISVFACCSVFNLVSADNTDCSIFGNMTYKQKDGENFPIVEQRRETEERWASGFLTPTQQRLILTKKDLNTAILNLKKYCCENNIGGVAQGTCDIDKSFFNPNAMDSEYLFDHIFDVMMRRLAGLTGDKNIFEKSNMTEVDDKGKGWREFIKDKAEDLSGSDAQSIIDEYNEYWVKSNPNLGYDITEDVNRNFAKSDQDFLRFVVWENGMKGDKNGKVAEAMKNYDKWTLYDRYSNVCALSKYFYSLLQVGNNTDKNVIVNRLTKGSCERFVDSQVENENYYVQTVVQNSANLLMENYIEGYLQYLYDRSNKLKDMWRSAEDRWMDVIRAVPYLLKACVR